MSIVFPAVSNGMLRSDLFNLNASLMRRRSLLRFTARLKRFLGILTNMAEDTGLAESPVL